MNSARLLAAWYNGKWLPDELRSTDLIGRFTDEFVNNPKSTAILEQGFSIDRFGYPDPERRACYHGRNFGKLQNNFFGDPR